MKQPHFALHNTTLFLPHRERRLCSNPMLHDINNNSAHREMELETVAVLIHFHSDDTYTESGFKLEYELLGIHISISYE